jgi:hypothetical protein
MAESRISTRATPKATRSVLHARKLERETDPLTGEAVITDSNLAALTVDSYKRHALIEQLAYQYSESRGFEPGHELDDWLAAETTVDAKLMNDQFN